MPPVLDIRTMVLIYVGINIGQTIVLFYLWSVQRNYPPAKDWAIGSLLFAIGLFLFSLRTQVPLVLSEIVSNFFLLPGLMLFNFGVVKAAGRVPPIRFGVATSVIVCVILAWYVVGDAHYPTGVVIHNAAILAVYLYTAYVCVRAKTASGNHTFRLIGGLFLLLALVCVWRVAGGVFGLTFSLPPTLPRLVWIASSLICIPMVTVLLTLHTSQRLQEEIEAQARRDALTGAYNRRAFAEFADKEWSRSQRHRSPLSVLSVDIDHFKSFNDLHGHPTGDAALVEVSKSAQAALRAADIWCRHGGEEFIALLPETSIEQALAVAERLRVAVERTTIPSPSGPLNVSVSIGVAERSLRHENVSELLAVSDAALYQAKATGRNRAVAAAQKAPEPVRIASVA